MHKQMHTQLFPQQQYFDIALLFLQGLIQAPLSLKIVLFLYSLDVELHCAELSICIW